MTLISKLSLWHETSLGAITFAVIELALTYGFASLAIDRGNLWWYLLTLIFLIGSIKNIFKIFGTFIHGRHKTS